MDDGELDQGVLLRGRVHGAHLRGAVSDAEPAPFRTEGRSHPLEHRARRVQHNGGVQDGAGVLARANSPGVVPQRLRPLFHHAGQGFRFLDVDVRVEQTAGIG